MKTIHCFVSGKVQGVFYRQETQKKAQELGVDGWVRNLEDGRVELMATGDENLVDELAQWLHQGPEMAEVSGVELQVITSEAWDGFKILQ